MKHYFSPWPWNSLLLALTLFSTFCCSKSSPNLDIEEYDATIVDLSNSNAILYRQETTFLGASCISGPVKSLGKQQLVQIGDVVAAGDHSFKVGIIQVTKFNEDFINGKEMIAKKGDIVCVLAGSKDLLPYEDDCKALWVRAVGCKPTQYFPSSP